MLHTKVLLDRAPNPRDSKLIVSSTQDVEPILEANKIARSQSQRGHDCARLIADIPCVILVQWLNEEYARGNTHLRLFTKEFNREVVAKKLLDPDWAYLRCDQ